MGDAILTAGVVLAVSLALFYLGAKYGAAVEQQTVAEVLAAFDHDLEKLTIKRILLNLKAEYAREYLAIKKAL
jgi:hypothetical protein